MGATAAITASLGASAYSIYSSAKQARKTPLMPDLPKLPPTPQTATDAQTNAVASNSAMAAQRRKLASQGGRSGTLLTGPQGITSPAPLQRATLLGR